MIRFFIHKTFKNSLYFRIYLTVVNIILKKIVLLLSNKVRKIF